MTTPTTPSWCLILRVTRSIVCTRVFTMPASWEGRSLKCKHHLHPKLIWFTVSVWSSCHAIACYSQLTPTKTRKVTTPAACCSGKFWRPKTRLCTSAGIETFVFQAQHSKKRNRNDRGARRSSEKCKAAVRMLFTKSSPCCLGGFWNTSVRKAWSNRSVKLNHHGVDPSHSWKICGTPNWNWNN